MFVILSAQHSDGSAVENVQAHRELGQYLKRAPFNYREVKGCWKGKIEDSYQVYLPANSDYSEFMEEMETLAFKDYCQDAILVVHTRRVDDVRLAEASFHYSNGRVSEPESWCKVSEAEASILLGWTFYAGDFYATL